MSDLCNRGRQTAFWEVSPHMDEKRPARPGSCGVLRPLLDLTIDTFTRYPSEARMRIIRSLDTCSRSLFRIDVTLVRADFRPASNQFAGLGVLRQDNAWPRTSVNAERPLTWSIPQ